MPVLTEEARTALTAGHLAHLTTLGPDGAPHVTIVWVGLDGDEIVSAHLGRYQKIRNVERDPRVVISMLTGGRNPMGLDFHLVVYGRARVTEGGAPELLQRLARTYLGPDVVFPPMPDPPPGFILRTAPRRLGGIGPWAPPRG
ncbi:MAG TPA: TIGR03618 family F420-dependent PPOX class oxidoreductase [Actinomycetota bacterium]|nr:TIGR03618 family F420-dependent PPOX class oxidoreductase [Actinomycetota bacterium]